jgi:hypothetical protein
MTEDRDMTTTKTNKYEATCEKCGNRVPVGQGNLRRFGSRWIVEHRYTQDSQGNCLHPAYQRTFVKSSEVMARRTAKAMTTSHPYIGRTWAEVMEASEYFDGEPEATDLAHRTWVIVNARAEMEADPTMHKFIPHLDTTTNWGDPTEAVAHAMEEWHDRRHG